MMENTLTERVAMITEQMAGILESMGATVELFQLNYHEIQKANRNPLHLTTFTAVINDIPYKAKTFSYYGYETTEDAYINSIKAYLFDVLDGVANL